MSREKDEIDTEIASLTHTLTQTPDDHPDLPQLLNRLGMRHMKRFYEYHDPADPEKAVEYISIALTLTPNDDPEIPTLCIILSVAYGSLFEHRGELDDINKAIENARISVNLTPEGNSKLLNYLKNLGAFHGIRFQHLGNLCDLEDSIEHLSCALALAPEGSSELPTILDDLGLSHRERYLRMGGLNDLDAAVAYQSRGVSLATDDYSRYPSMLNDLGSSHNVRFLRLGEVADLDKAIEYESRALGLAPSDHPERPYIFMSLGLSHYTRYMHQGHIEDLSKVIEYQSQAVSLTPDGNPELPTRLANLGNYCLHRFEQLDDLDDLDNAIKYQYRAIALTPTGHPRPSKMYSNLGAAYHARYNRQGKPNDLQRAISYEIFAISLTPKDHPDLGTMQHNFGRTQMRCYRRTGKKSHLRLALELYRGASNSLSAPPNQKFKFAQAWAKATSEFDPIEAYQTAIDLLPQVIWLGSTTNQRYENLLTAGALVADAAAAAIRFSRYRLALEWLEHTRCVVWNQHFMLRSPVDQLMSVNSSLATRLQTVATQLHLAGSESREARVVTSGLISAEQVAQEHRQLAKAYEDMLVQIRQLEGFEDFLRPIKADVLVHAARAGPVVVINCHEKHCDALIMLPGEDQVHHVALPSFSAEKAQQARKELETLLRAKGVRERGVKVRQLDGQVVTMAGVLVTLWHNVVKPILEFLGYMDDNLNADPPHITWCPTGALSFLPLHAAGDYSNQSRARVFDYVISSYTPTLTALLASSPSSLSTDCRILAIGQADTPGRRPLPGTEKEIEYIRNHTESNAKYSQLLSHQATVSAVLDGMEQHDWVHLACHAHQNVMDPTKSGFFLHDGTLDLAAINRRSFKGKGLAFLSACQTATGDEKLADEAVHLASGMLMAGYTSVIGTMWSVNDKDAPLVADKVYAQLMKDKKLGNGEAGRALHYAVTYLRETVGEQRFERWVPYIHIGS
ncbi:unnamed protein product [Rhizoctonia solani]|uniref:CHAT domain-containing protein n=1 Tax=Rhizoctonia solani TaxID=456999 RepID=A0A8H3DYN5_9AGAM|nr:unnamed protein product [Rhizoctonia solani]